MLNLNPVLIYSVLISFLAGLVIGYIMAAAPTYGLVTLIILVILVGGAYTVYLSDGK